MKLSFENFFLLEGKHATLGGFTFGLDLLLPTRETSHTKGTKPRVSNRLPVA
jgi:hypothetical protein